jgi:hypothetical protein
MEKLSVMILFIGVLPVSRLGLHQPKILNFIFLIYFGWDGMLAMTNLRSL